MAKKYQYPEDEWVTPTVDEPYRMACCDCCLVHNIEFRAIRVKKRFDDGTFAYEDMDPTKYRVAIRVTRNNRSTSKLRKARNVTVRQK